MKNYEQETDETLVIFTQQGDHAAMDFLMDKYKNLVRGRARTLFLVGADKEDLIQEGMIGLYKAIRDYKPEKNSSFQNFAELCVNRQMYSAIKGSRTKKNQPLNDYVSFDSMAYVEGQETTSEHLIEIISEKNKNPEQLVIDKELLMEFEVGLRLEAVPHSHTYDSRRECHQLVVVIFHNAVVELTGYVDFLFELCHFLTLCLEIFIRFQSGIFLGNTCVEGTERQGEFLVSANAVGHIAIGNRILSQLVNICQLLIFTDHRFRRVQHTHAQLHALV